MVAAAETLSRHERAVLRGLDMDARVTDLEDADDEDKSAIHDLTKAINRLTWAIGSGLFTLVAVLLAAVLSR